jgi:bifunctional DNase/RNase
MNTPRPENSTEFYIYGIIPYDRINGSYSLILKDNEDLGKMVCLIIGSAEAQSIAIFLEGVELDRPFTHDLFCNVLMDRSIDVDYIVIDDNHEQTFFASMAFSDGVVTDCRPSDGISIAIRLGSPIFINNDIVDVMSFDYGEVKGMKSSNDEKKEMAKKPTKKKKQKDESLRIDPADLEKRLEEAIEKEDYELAAKLRDQINKK